MTTHEDIDDLLEKYRERSRKDGDAPLKESNFDCLYNAREILLSDDIDEFEEGLKKFDYLTKNLDENDKKIIPTILCPIIFQYYQLDEFKDRLKPYKIAQAVGYRPATWNRYWRNPVMRERIFEKVRLDPELGIYDRRLQREILIEIIKDERASRSVRISAIRELSNLHDAPRKKADQRTTVYAQTAAIDASQNKQIANYHFDPSEIRGLEDEAIRKALRESAKRDEEIIESSA